MAPSGHYSPIAALARLAKSRLAMARRPFASLRAPSGCAVALRDHTEPLPIAHFPKWLDREATDQRRVGWLPEGNCQAGGAPSA